MHPQFPRARRNSSYTPYNKRFQTLPTFLEFLPPVATHTHTEPNTEYCDRCLNNQLNHLLLEIRQPEEQWELRVGICQRIEHLIQESLPQYGFTVHIYGSTLNGLCLQNGDLDLSLISATQVDIYTLYQITELLKKERFDNVTFIDTARVPVIKFRDVANNIRCDLSLNQVFALYTSEYFLQASYINPLFVHVTLILKYWLKSRSINNPFHGTLASCALATMILFYFQKLEPPLFPSTFVQTLNKQMQPVFFCDTKKIPRSVLSRHTVGSLVLGFFRFYATFDYNTVISVIPTDPLPFLEPTMLTVLDPTNLSVNLSRVVTAEGLSQILHEIVRARDILEGTSDFMAVLKFDGE